MASPVCFLSSIYSRSLTTARVIASSTYDAKDLMRMSYVCRNAEETIAIFNALTNQENQMFTVYQIKNGFEE
jgi:hypothetical protein